MTEDAYDGYRMQKQEPVGALQAALQSEQLKIAAGLPLVAEAQNFRATINPTTAHDSYSAWRESDHDARRSPRSR